MKFLNLLLVLWISAQAALGLEFTRAQEGRIARTVGTLLENFHFRQAPLDDAMSETFLKNYLDALDYNHLIFLQEDVDEFTRQYAHTLDDAVQNGDVKPAHEIFNRYLTRLEECNTIAQKFLKESHDFTKDESFVLSRNKLPFPSGEADRENLWRLRIKYDLLQGRLTKEKPEETLKTLSKRYSRLLRNMKEFEAEDILQVYLGALALGYDPHTTYFNPTEAENFSINTIKLSLSGIGALLRSEDGITKIVSIVPGGPADLSKELKPEDKIIAVAQGTAEPVDTIEMKLNKVVDMIRGTRGTEVRLTVIPAAASDGATRKVVSLKRDEIKLTEQFAKAKVFETVDAKGITNRLGVINLPQFYDNCAHDVERMIDRLKKEKVDGIALDLRRNSGGLLGEAVTLTGLFVGEGPVVQVKENRRQTQVLKATENKAVYTGPLVVLVSRLSASASEIVAAALQDYGRAVIVGDQTTHGKGTVQSMLSLDQFIRKDLVEKPGQLKLTAGKFYRVNGTTTQKVGMTPDIILPSRFDHMELGEASLPTALPATTIQATEYPHFNQVRPFVKELGEKSVARVKTGREFAYINEDIELLEKQKKDKSVSLNEAKRIEERDKNKARIEARKKERALHPPASYKVYEVSLDMLDKDKPLVPMAVMKVKENASLASNTPSTTAAAPDGAEEADLEKEPVIDPTLDEEVAILGDYVKLFAKSPASTSSEKLVQTH